MRVGYPEGKVRTTTVSLSEFTKCLPFRPRSTVEGVVSIGGF